ncbi:MAG: dihydrofolate reductase [Bacilli bacterium]
MLSLIVAFDKNQVIGKDNAMPWHYPEDLKYFKKTTLNHKIIMGANTFNSILNYLNHPFSNRHSLIVTDMKFDKTYENVTYYDNLEDIINEFENSGEEVFVAGGMSIYNQMIDHCQKLYITHIDKSFNGDAFFPKFNYNEFTKLSSNKLGDLDFCVYERKQNV